MKNVEILTRTIPSKPRSNNYSSGGAVINTGGGTSSSGNDPSKLDKSVWDRNFEERADDTDTEYLFVTKPLILAAGITMYSGDSPDIPSIYAGLPIDGQTLYWENSVLKAKTASGGLSKVTIKLGNTVYDSVEGIVSLPSYPSLSGYATESWVNDKQYLTAAALNGYATESWVTGKGYLIATTTDKANWNAAFSWGDHSKAGYAKAEALKDYVTLGTAQDIQGVKNFTAANTSFKDITINGFTFKKKSDGVLELDGNLVVTGGVTMFAVGAQTASTILDALLIDTNTLSKEGGKLSVIGGGGGKGSVNAIKWIETTYNPDTNGLITLPSAVTLDTAQTITATKVFSEIQLSKGKQIKRIAESSSWYNGRDNALLRILNTDGYNPILSSRTSLGSWEIGTYGSYDENFRFNYITDSNYNANVNTQTQQFIFKLNGDIQNNNGNIFLHGGNYNTYSPTLVGGGASGNWNIDIQGRANMLREYSSLVYGASGLQYFNANLTGGNIANQNTAPTSNWYHILRMNHANSLGYYTDIAAGVNTNDLWYRRIGSGAVNGWFRIMDQNNIGNTVGITKGEQDLTAVGWHRIGECINNDAIGGNFILKLHRVYSYANNESYTFSINQTYSNNWSITQLSGAANSRLIPQIRICSRSDTTNKSYIEFYIGIATNANHYYWTFEGDAIAYASATSVSSPVGTPVYFDTSTDLVTGYATANNIASRGAMLVNATGLNGGNYDEGIRICSHANGWSNINFGCANAWNGYIANQWVIGKNPSHNFVIAPSPNQDSVNFSVTRDGSIRNIVKDVAIAAKTLTYPTDPYGLITYIDGDGSVRLQVQREANNSETFKLRLNTNGGNVSIGNVTGDTYKLEVAGSVYADGWFRSNGNAGWYSESYGGGIYMIDTTYVRTWGNKKLHSGDTGIDCFNAAGGFHSSMNTSTNDTWATALSYSEHVYNMPNIYVNANSYQRIIGWCNVINAQGYQTRYSIGSRRLNNSFGGISLAIGNSDAGTSGHQLMLWGHGLIEWTGTGITLSRDSNPGGFNVSTDALNITGNKVLYNDGFRTWGIGGHNCGLKLFCDSHIGINLANSSYTWGIYSNSNGGLYFGRRNGNVNDSSGTYYMDLNSGALSVATNILVTGAVTMIYTSDYTLKCNIRPVTDASKRLMSLGGVYDFEYINDEVSKNSIYAGEHTGLIYQNVKDTCMKRMCHERKDGKGSINYIDTSFISLLAAVGMEHETRIQKLERENRELKDKLNKLERSAA